MTWTCASQKNQKYFLLSLCMKKNKNRRHNQASSSNKEHRKRRPQNRRDHPARKITLRFITNRLKRSLKKKTLVAMQTQVQVVHSFQQKLLANMCPSFCI
jgi:hypothetical protein